MILLLPLLLMLSSDRCATVNVRPTPTVVTAGSTMGFQVIVTNCGDKPVMIKTYAELETACGGEVDLPKNYWRLQPGQAFQPNMTYPIPSDACPGIYRVLVEASVGNTVIGSGDATFEVVE